VTEEDETEGETTERPCLLPVWESAVEDKVVAFTTGAETAKTVFVVEARTRVVEDRGGVLTGLAAILEELRRHKSRLMPLLP